MSMNNVTAATRTTATITMHNQAAIPLRRIQARAGVAHGEEEGEEYGVEDAGRKVHRVDDARRQGDGKEQPNRAAQGLPLGSTFLFRGRGLRHLDGHRFRGHGRRFRRERLADGTTGAASSWLMRTSIPPRVDDGMPKISGTALTASMYGAPIQVESITKGSRMVRAAQQSAGGARGESAASAETQACATVGSLWPSLLPYLLALWSRRQHGPCSAAPRGERSGRVPLEDTKPASANASEQRANQQQAAQAPPALTDQERAVLDLLVASTTARTVAQLSAASGLPRDQVANAIESLRVQGLVTRFNTVIESYGARFPVSNCVESSTSRRLMSNDHDEGERGARAPG